MYISTLHMWIFVCVYTFIYIYVCVQYVEFCAYNTLTCILIHRLLLLLLVCKHIDN